MLTLGLTGGSGAGKGYVSEIFAARGIPSLDTDQVSREVTLPGTPCLAELTEAFGAGILNPDGSLARRKLGEIVFSDSAALKTLNAISHRHILASCREWLAERRKEGLFAAIIDAPQLYESRFNCECDYVIAVLCDRDTRIARILERDGITREAAEKRIAAQYSDEFFRNAADYLLYNNADSRVDLQIDLLLQQLHWL